MNTQKLILLTFTTIAVTFILGQWFGFNPLDPVEIFIGYTLIMVVMCATYSISIPSVIGFAVSIGITGVGIPVMGITSSLVIPVEINAVLQISLYLIPSAFPFIFIYREFFHKNTSVQVEPTSA